MDRIWECTDAIPVGKGTLVEIEEPCEKTHLDFEYVNTMDQQRRKVGEQHGGVDAIEPQTSRLASRALSTHEDSEEEGKHERTDSASCHELLGQLRFGTLTGRPGPRKIIKEPTCETYMGSDLKG